MFAVCLVVIPWRYSSLQYMWINHSRTPNVTKICAYSSPVVSPAELVCTKIWLPIYASFTSCKLLHFWCIFYLHSFEKNPCKSGTFQFKPVLFQGATVISLFFVSAFKIYFISSFATVSLGMNLFLFPPWDFCFFNLKSRTFNIGNVLGIISSNISPFPYFFYSVPL